MKHQDVEVPAYDIQIWLGKVNRHCLVIPVINEGDRITQLLQKIHSLRIHESVDVVIVDGGSSDGSLEPARLQDLGIRGLLVKRGPGRLSAQLRCAYGFALEQDYAGIITIDGNNKDDPSAIPDFVKRLEQGFDFVQASRYVDGGIGENTPLSRTIAIRCIHAPLLRLASGFPWTDTTQGFRAYSAKMLMDPRIAPFRNVFSEYELLAYLSYRAPRLGHACIEIPTARRYPAGGKTPTKITSVQGNFGVLRVLLQTCVGMYNPRL